MTKDTLAAIDVGSNAIRLLISNVERNGKTDFRKAAFIRVPIRLGEDVFTTGRIGEDKQRRLVEAMRGFAGLMSAFEVRAHRACATSAMREASNGPEIVARIRGESGVVVEIISGREEAGIIFEAGGIAGLMDSDKHYLYVDVGGGSTEVSVYSNRRRARSKSFALGTVRSISGATEAGEMDRFKEYLRGIKRDFDPVAIIGSGGNINKAHKMLAGKDKEPLRATELEDLYRKLSDMSYEERMEKMGLNDYRADVILPALDIFITAARRCRIEDIVVPKIGLVDGIIHGLSKSKK